MRKSALLWCAIVASASAARGDATESEAPETAADTRCQYAWPFSADSIWNTPIGSEAEYAPAGVGAPGDRAMTVDEGILILEPDAPMTPVRFSGAGWDRSADRCIPTGDLLFEAPIPADFVVSPENWDGLTPNASMAVLMPDGRTLKQAQPFARCEAGSPATALVEYPAVDLYGEGEPGAHGGSGLSSIGGTIRLGELVPGGAIRHALKVNVYAAKYLYYDAATQGYRWPAVKADGYAQEGYGGRNPELRMGALLALPAELDLGDLGLETEPGRMIARAFQDYGGYVVDDTAWDGFALATEWSPQGRVIDEFEQAWGLPFSEGDHESPWGRDMRRIFTNLHVVTNNGPARPGGGGEPRRPLAPPFSSQRP